MRNPSHLLDITDLGALLEQSFSWILVHVHLLQCSNLSDVHPQGAASTSNMEECVLCVCLCVLSV